MLKALLSKLTKYRDLFGILTQASGDGGDSAQRTGSLYALLAALKAEQDDRGKSVIEGFRYDLDKLQAFPGRYRRHPDGRCENGRWVKWYANPNNFTRDQSSVLQAAMVMLDMESELRDIYAQRKTRYLFHFNSESYDDSEPIRTKFPDPPSLIEVGQFIRGLHKWYLYPLLLITDLELFGFLILRKFSERTRYDSGNMYVPLLLSSLHRYATPWGILAKKLYSRTNDMADVRKYYSEAEGRNGLEPLGELYELVFNTVIKGEK